MHVATHVLQDSLLAELDVARSALGQGCLKKRE